VCVYHDIIVIIIEREKDILEAMGGTGGYPPNFL